MENDWDLNLLKQMQPNHHQVENKEGQPDFMLQPITTQTKFNQKNGSGNDSKINEMKRLVQEDKKSIVSSELTKKRSTPVKESKLLDDNDESKKFRQYLSERVEQLRKSKEIITNEDTQPNKQNTQSKRSTTLRKIITNEQSKQQKVQKQHKVQSQSEKPTKQQISKAKEQGEKRFTNSHSSLAKHNEIELKANNNLTEIRKSFQLQNNKKQTKLPSITSSSGKVPLSKQKNQGVPAHDRNNQRKNTIDPTHQKDIADKQKDHRKTPESKNSFRIKRTSNLQTNNNQAPIDTKKPKQVSLKSLQKESPIHQGKQKRMRQQFIRLNQEQKNLQQEIFKNHQNNKNFLQSIMKKYKISTSSFQKYGIKKDSQFSSDQPKQALSPQKRETKESRVERSSQKEIKSSQEVRVQSPLKKQKRKNQFLTSDIQKINTLLIQRQKQIQKHQHKVQKNLFYQFLKQQPEDILEEPDQDEADQVEELPNPQMSKYDPKGEGKDFSSTYSSVMSEMKTKKWGLKQRITFETHRQSVEGRSDSKQAKTIDNFASQKQRGSVNDKVLSSHYDAMDQGERLNNKIEVNSRLKNLLFD